MGRPLWRLLSRGVPQAVVLRNGPTLGLLTAAYLTAAYTALR